MTENDEDKTLADIVHEAAAVAATAGRVTMGLGLRVAPVQDHPKHVALELLKTSDEFKTLSEMCSKLASSICDIDARTTKIQTTPTFVGLDGKPLV